MREDLTLTWFYDNECVYCARLEPEVEEFAQYHHARIVRIEKEDGIEVPAIMFNHPKTKGLVIVGSFCLDALRWHLAQ